MQRRTYGKRALRQRAREQGQPDSPSPQRKRLKVVVEIVSPKPKWTPKPPTPTPTPTPEPQTPERRQSPRGSVVKRMLGRTRTLQETPVPPAPAASARHSLPTAFPERECTPEASSQSSPKPLPTRNLRTYAGSSRSFLLALPVPDAGASNAVEDDTEPHESYADLRTRWGIDMSEDDPQPYQDSQPASATPLRRTASELSQASLPAGMMNDLKSITELRSKGESRRFLDEVGYLFEGLDASSPIGLRRASALEIVNKLCDFDFNRRAKTSDFYVRTWDKLFAARAGTTDKILDATITFFASLAARDPRTITEVAQQEGFIPSLVEFQSSFDYESDVLASALASSSDDDLKSHAIFRTEITALRSLARLATKESSSSQNQPSARFFVSHSLAAVPPSLLAANHLPALLANLRAELGLLDPRITAYESGLPLLPPNQSSTPSLHHIEACLRLLDSYLLGHWASGGDDPSTGLSHMNGFTSELISLCVASSSVMRESEDETVVAQKCLCGAMRALTLLSHDDPWWCSATLEVSHAFPFVAMTVMRSQARWSESRNVDSQHGSVEAFDLLCLALGLVMNWATLSPKVPVLSRISSIDPACPGSRLCVRACRCPDQKSVLECFTTLHVQYSDDLQDDFPERAFLRGYTAILLGLLIKDDAPNQTIVTSTLPGASRSDKLKSLISHCHSFLDFYSDTASLPSPRASPEAIAHETAGSHRGTWDGKGEEVARSVISSLEVLCNA